MRKTCIRSAYKLRGVGSFPRVFDSGLRGQTLRDAVGRFPKRANLGGRQIDQPFASSPASEKEVPTLPL